MPTDDQLEQIVNAVLAQLDKRADGGDSSSSSQQAASSAGSGELVISDKVVSAATLAGRLANVQRLIIPARAVVTPSARDLLKEKNVTLVRSLKSTSPTSVRVALGMAGVKYDVEGLVRLLRQHGIDVTQLPTVGLAQLTAELAKDVSKAEKLGVLLTDNVAAALCIANRQRGVRAATAGNRGEVNDIVRGIGANFLVIDPMRRSPLELQRIVEAFVTAPARQCPAELKSALE
jgi:ribose 5-phosphate isomerase RpiB